MIYVTPIVGTGTKEDPTRPKVVPRGAWTSIRGATHCLVYADEAVSHPEAIPLSLEGSLPSAVAVTLEQMLPQIQVDQNVNVVRTLAEEFLHWQVDRERALMHERLTVNAQVKANIPRQTIHLGPHQL